MADIAKGSVYMAAVDKAAAAAESILNDQVASVIEEAFAEGKINNARRIELKKLCASAGAKMVSIALGVHAKLIDAAQAIGEDVPPPSDGTAELVAVIEGMVSPLGGGR